MAFKKSKEDFIISARKIHGNTYSYDKVVYINSKTSVLITCSVHGDFNQKPNSHLNGNSCPKCSKRYKKTTEEFIQECVNIHGDGKYDYSNVVYNNNKQKISIRCIKHNENIEVYARSHLNGVGCVKCKIDTFLPKFIKVHGSKYSYSISEYNGYRNTISIECPVHGIFEQNPFYHLDGCGCPKCGKYISHGERAITNYLNTNGIVFLPEHRFSECKYKNTLPFDFFIPSYNICIEYDGQHHFQPVSHFGGDKTYKLQKIKDAIKTKFCEENNILLVRISYMDMENIEDILNGLF